MIRSPTSQSGVELYNLETDPYEWNNLANTASSALLLAEFRKRAPTDFAKRVAPSVDLLTKLRWRDAPSGPAPASKPDGKPFFVYFINNRRSPVELFWMDRQGHPRSYSMIAAGARRRQQTRPGAVWMIQDVAARKPLGHFIVDDRTAQAIVPSGKIAK